MTPVDGPAKGWAAEAISPRRWERMAGLARAMGKRPNLWRRPVGPEVNRRPQGRDVGVDRGALRWPCAAAPD